MLIYEEPLDPPSRIEAMKKGDKQYIPWNPDFICNSAQQHLLSFYCVLGTKNESRDDVWIIYLHP